MHEPSDRQLREQAGIVSRTQLLAAGWSASAIGRAVEAGRLHPVARGVYRVNGAVWSRRAARTAALLVAGPQAAIAGWSAAELHGLAPARPGPVHVVVPRHRYAATHAPKLVRVRRSTSLRAGDRTRVDGLPVTSAARTLLDLAPVASSPEHLAELVATAVRVGACEIAEVAETVAHSPRAHGRRRLLDALTLLAEDGSEARSEAEIGALGAIVGAGLPRPQVAYRVVGEDGGFIAEVDLAYPDLRIAIEVDGYRWHSSPAQKRRDEQRQNLIVLAGWRVLRFSASEVRRHPARVVEAVRRALGAADTARGSQHSREPDDGRADRAHRTR